MSDIVERLMDVGVEGGDNYKVARETIEEITRLRAENAELRKDAERYKMLRSVVCTDDDTEMVNIFEGSFAGDFPTHEEFDAAIDAAMEGKK